MVSSKFSFEQSLPLYVFSLNMIKHKRQVIGSDCTQKRKKLKNRNQGKRKLSEQIKQRKEGKTGFAAFCRSGFGQLGSGEGGGILSYLAAHR